MTALNPVFTVVRQLTERARLAQKNMSKSQAEAACARRLFDPKHAFPSPPAAMQAIPAMNLSGRDAPAGGDRQALACFPRLLIADETQPPHLSVNHSGPKILALIDRLKPRPAYRGDVYHP